jgi:predicted transcriptional regulator
MKMGQKNLKATVSVSLSADTLEKINRLAAEHQRTRSATVEIILNKFLDAEEG